MAEVRQRPARSGHDALASAAASPTAAVAAFAAETRFEDLPSEVVRQVKRCLLDYVGLAIGAADQPAVSHALEAVQTLGGAPQASVLGTAVRTSAEHAALVNGIASHVLDYDDTHLPTVVHPTGPAMSAALAVGEWKNATGRDLITAFALGFEVECRVGLAVHPEHYDAGWHITGTAGAFGAAAAAGRLLGLDARRMSWALGMAGSQAAGVREQFGSMTKSLHIGRAAASGVLGAVLASLGFDATEQIFEGRRGFCAVLSTGQHLERLTEKLGQHWEFENNGIKPYACGVVTHPVIDAVRRLREREGLTAAQVQRIDARVHPLVPELTGKREPQAGLEGKFSLYHCAAIALIEGQAGPAQFTDEAVRRPEVVELRRKVEVQAESTLAENQAEVNITLKDGRTVSAWIEAATGTPQNPVSDQELKDKVHDLVWPHLPRWKEERLLEIVDSLVELEDVGMLAELLSPPEEEHADFPA
jgi:2-methylcitrate dehydratase PrpD